MGPPKSSVENADVKKRRRPPTADSVAKMNKKNEDEINQLKARLAEVEGKKNEIPASVSGGENFFEAMQNFFTAQTKSNSVSDSAESDFSILNEMKILGLSSWDMRYWPSPSQVTFFKDK